LNFDETIKSIRRKSLLSQSDFAKALGVSFSTVNRWENGKAAPKLCTLKLLNTFCAENGIPFNGEEFITDNTRKATRME
jgi:putative transcriptional regulator